MSSLTKMAVLPLPVYERLAKYEKNYPYIKNLVEADVQKEKILNSGSNIMATHLAYNLNQQKIDAGKVKLFPPQIDKPHGHNPKMLHQGIGHPVEPKPYSQNIGNRVESVLSPQPTLEEDIEYAEEVKEAENAEAGQEAAIAEEVGVEDEEDEFEDSGDLDNPIDDSSMMNLDESVLESEQEEFTTPEKSTKKPKAKKPESTEKEFEISPNSKQAYASIKEMEKIINTRVPRTHLFFGDDGTVFLNGTALKNSKMNAILNFIATPNAQYVAGATKVLNAMLRVPEFDYGGMVKK